MRNPFIERARARAREAVNGRLEAGEEIEVLLFAVTRPSVWLDALISPLLAVLQRTWYVVLTNRRVFLVPFGRRSGRPIGIDWEEPRGGVRVERYKRGVLMGKLFLRRLADDRVMKLRVPLGQKDAALEVKRALES